MNEEKYLKEHINKYPLLELSDKIKFLFQGFFGPRHYVIDAKALEEKLLQEYFLIKDENTTYPLYEIISESYIRVYLKPFYRLHLSFKKLIELFMLSLDDNNEIDSYKDMIIRVLGNDEYVLNYLESNYLSISHSMKYKEIYKPHYLVIKRDYINEIEGGDMKSKVYFSKNITPETVLKLYETLGFDLKGNVCVKVHSGEPGNQNFIRPDFWKNIIDKVNGTVVECNTAYNGKRHITSLHLQTFKEHGWDVFPIDLLDAEGPDLELDIPNGKVIKKNYIGKDIVNYDSMLVLSHFKGHPMGGYGGAIKQLSIGLASSYGKKYIHGAGNVDELWTAPHDSFLESMADAASSVIDYFKGNIVYINVMKNMSVDCDCCAVAEDPCIKDIGILISLDPIAIDQACIDLVYQCDDEKKDHLIERIESRNGIHTIEASEALGFGNRNYELIVID